MLKDILTVKLGAPGGSAAAPNPAPEAVADGSTSTVAPDGDTVETAEVVAVGLLDESVATASSSAVDTMPTIPMATGEEWPNRPWLPKSTLLRWSKPIATHCRDHGVATVEKQESISCIQLHHVQ